jgi:signal transduction histidine kinase
LAAVKIDFASLVRDLPLDEKRAAKAESMMTLVNNTIDAVRRISTELRPGILDDLGLLRRWTGRLKSSTPAQAFE